MIALRRVLLAASIAFLALAAAAAVGFGPSFELVGVAVSARRVPALVAQAAAALLLALLAGFETPVGSRRGVVAAVVIAFLVALVIESSPRRTGDGGEYLVMARNFSSFAPPSIAAGELPSAQAWLDQLPGFSGASLRDGVVAGRGDRLDFAHFWLYPLAAAPLLGVTDGFGWHPNYAFTVLNLALLALLLIVCLRLDVGIVATVLLTCGPIVWWIDKTHIEVWTYVFVVLGILGVGRTPHLAALSFAAAATQNPPVAVLALGAVVRSLAGGAWKQRAGLVTLVATVLLLALHPLYYYWRVGMLSPLSATATLTAPTVTLLLTPIVDLNLGLIVYMPLLVGPLAIGGLALMNERMARWRIAGWTAALALPWFLLAFSQTPNINHGGTPGPSRYALWLLALAAPLFAGCAGLIRPSRRRAAILLTALAMIHVFLVFRPRQPERYLRPTGLATWVWRHAPTWYSPLPEVFAERVAEQDGRARIPVATADCHKVLLAGTGAAEVAWPNGCRAATPPEGCLAPRALCYASLTRDGYRFAAVPPQPGFRYEVAEPDAAR